MSKPTKPLTALLRAGHGAPRTIDATLQGNPLCRVGRAHLAGQLDVSAFTTEGRAFTDASYGAYVDQVPAYTLAVNNAMSLFGLHRRLRGRCTGWWAGQRRRLLR